MILATSCQLGLSLLQARQTYPQLPFPSFSSSEMQQGVPSNFLTLTFFLPFIIKIIIINKILFYTLPFIISFLLTAMSRVTQIPPSQSKKIFCAYHTNEVLTNFCCDADCLMPLCPSCIVEHTEQHFLENNKPIYVNLQDIIAQTKQKCYQNIIVFEDLNRSNDKIYDYIVGLRESIHNQLNEDKQEIIKELDRLFQIFQQKLFTETMSKYREEEVYDKKQTVNITQFITEQIETLHDQIAILKGDNCLAGLITYFSNDAKIYSDSIQELQSYVQKHKQVGKILINNNSTKLSAAFKNFCDQNLVIEYINEEKEQEKLKESRQQSREGNSLLGRLGKKRQNLSKQNNLNHNNSDYREVKRQQDYFRVDPSQAKYSRIHQSKSSVMSTYSRPNIHIRHHN